MWNERKKQQRFGLGASTFAKSSEQTHSKQQNKRASHFHATAQRNVMRYAFSASWPMLDGESSPEKCGPNER